MSNDFTFLDRYYTIPDYTNPQELHNDLVPKIAKTVPEKDFATKFGEGIRGDWNPLKILTGIDSNIDTYPEDIKNNFNKVVDYLKKNISGNATPQEQQDAFLKVAPTLLGEAPATIIGPRGAFTAGETRRFEEAAGLFR